MSRAIDQDPRLLRYQDRTEPAAMLLALVFVAGYGFPIAWPGLPSWLRVTAWVVNSLIWLVFLADLIIRAALSRRPGRYLVRHPFDVLITVLPLLRPLQALRVFTITHALWGRHGGFSILRTTRAIVVSVGLLVLVCALAVLDAERGVPGGTIDNLGDALWWAITTVTTVGYGDTYPVTALGRIVASVLMLVGIATVGAVTATLGTWLLSRTRSGNTGG